MSTAPLPWRTATPDDAAALRDTERRAGLAALGHVFGTEPYPDADVLERWRSTLVEPGVLTEVLDGADGRLVALLAGDAEVLRHLAVDPVAWGRGLGTAAVARFVVRTPGSARLWCLAENHRALGFYERLGWERTGRTRRTPWPPEPVEVELALASAGGH